MEREIEIIETSWEWEVPAPRDRDENEHACDEMGVAEGVDLLGVAVAGVAIVLALAGIFLGAVLRLVG